MRNSKLEICRLKTGDSGWNARSVLECGGKRGKRSGTPLWLGLREVDQFGNGGVAATALPAQSKTCRLWLVCFCFLLSALCFRAWGQYSIDWSTIDSGGGTSTGGVLECGDLSPLFPLHRLVGEAAPRSAQRQVKHLSFPFAGFTTFGNQEQVCDGCGDGNVRPGFDQSGHRLAGFHPRVGVSGEGGNIMAHEHAPFPRGPSEYRRVVRAPQARVLNAHDIQGGMAPQQAAQDVVVEVLVEGEADPLRLSDGLGTTCQQARPNSLGIKSALVLRADHRPLLRARGEIRGDFRRMPQQVAEHGVHVGQRQDGILLDDFLGRRPALEGVSDRVQRQARAGHADDSVLVLGQRDRLGLCDEQAHGRKLKASARSGKRVRGRVRGRILC